MSKFFRGDSESESDSQYSESEEEEQVNIEERFAGNRFIYSSSESEEEGKRVVRAEKDKRLDELRGIARGLRNHLKISDWVALQNDFDKLSKAIEKSKNILISIAAANNNNTTAAPSAAASATALANVSASSLTLPLFILQTVHSIDLQQRESFANKELKKKLSAPNAKALNSMKQKIRKFIATYQTQFDNYIASGAKGEVEEEKEEDVAETKRKPTKSKKKVVKKKKESSDDEESDEEESDESSEDESSSDEDMRKKFTKKPAARRRSADSDEESERSEVESEEESEDESSAESSTDEEIDLASGNQKMFTREFWLKRKGDTSEEESESEDEEERAMRRRKIREEKQKKNLANEQQNVQRALQQGEAAAEKEREKGAEMSPEQVIRKLRELIAMRGKRGTDKLTLISDLKLLVSKAMEPAPLLKVHTTLASSLFDVVLNKRTAMPTPLWRECLHEVTEILNILQQNPNVRLSEDENVEESVWDDEASDNEAAAEESTSASSARPAEIEDFTTDASGKYQYIIGNLYSFLQLLFLDYRKSMQSIDFHTEEYIDRLRDEILLDELIQKAQTYYHSIGKTTLEASVAFLRLEIVYYKYEPENDILRARLLQHQAEAKDEEKAKIEDEKDQMDVLSFQHKTIGEATNPHVAEIGLTSQLATFLYKHGSDQARVRALLMHVYYLALHNHWTIARDMLLMSHIPETVQHADIKTQVLFNRAMTMLGLAAFRAGEFRHCLENLADLIQSNHIRELLAQGTSQQRWQQERDVEREEAEKKRQLPIHMHINQDHIEAAHLVSAMFAEVPNMALYGQANKKKMISKGFRRLFDGQSRQAFTGPPENTRDLIMAATRALRQGEWERSSELLMRLRMWSVLQPVVAAHVQRLIQIQIKETALETYLISYSPYFSSISATTLTQMFQLSHAQVFKVASTLILQEQLAGAWDQPLEVILMQQTAPSRLQRAALAYSEKVAALVDQNERMLDGRHGYQPFNKGRGPRDDKQKREGGDDHHEDRRREDGKRGGYRSGWVHRGRGQRFGEDRRRHRS